MTLEELFDAHHTSLFRFVAWMTNDPDYAKDVVQDTFLSIARRPIPPHASERAWLFQVARGLARSGLRKRSRRDALLRAASHRLPSGDAPATPEADAERAETRAVVRRALAALPEKQRTILLMREEGFTHREIAEAIGTTTGSVGTMWARALARLEARLDVEWRETP